MFRPLAIYIGLRYTRAKKRNHFISFISIVSAIGIALGVAVLITVLSVMNGFDYEIRSHIFNLSSQVTVADISGLTSNYQSLEKKVLQAKDVVSVAPFVMGEGMITNAGMVHGVVLTGILPSEESRVANLDSKMIAGKMSALKPNQFGIVLGAQIAQALNVTVGDNVVVITPKSSMTPFGVLPIYRRFKVVGIFEVGGGLGLDSTTAFLHLNDAQKLLQIGDTVSGLRIKINNLYAAPKVSYELQKMLPENFGVTNWTDQYQAFFKAVAMEKTMMFIILLFIIAVAAFNLVSTLVMTVTDKQADIAILRTLGASPKTIMAIFMVTGMVIGIAGTLIGVIGGVLLAIYAPNIVNVLQHVFHTQFISASVYFIDYLPSKLDWMNVFHVALSAFLMSLVATIYPAWRASKVQPAEALRYE